MDIHTLPRYNLILKPEKIGVAETFQLATRMIHVTKNATALEVFLFTHMSILSTLFDRAGFPLKFVLGIVGVTNSRKTSLVLALSQIFDREKLVADKEMFYVMLHTGLRVGEVGGLKWVDVDFDNKCINVRQSLSCNYYKGVKKQCLTTLKTQNSYRKIPFIGDMEEMLLSQKEKQNTLKKELKDRYRSTGEFEDLVFCTSMGSPISRYVAEKEINKVVAAINYEETINAALEHREPEVFEKVYPHALRHTFCSRCFEKGIAPKVVQALMGHAHYSTTIDIYTHVTEDKMGEELEKFQEVMKNQ